MAEAIPFAKHGAALANRLGLITGTGKTIGLQTLRYSLLGSERKR